MVPSSWTNRQPDERLFQNSVYVGINIESILYGIELFLYFKTIRILLTRNGGARTKSDLLYVLYSTITLFSVTVWVSTRAIFGQEMWLLQSDYPGGPDAFWQENVSVWYSGWGRMMAIILQLMMDGLRIHRCRIIWNNYRVVFVPTIMWLSTLTLGLFVGWNSNLPKGDIFTSRLALSYYTLSVFSNMVLTCLICYRILWHGRRVERCLGREYASSYFAAITIIVEAVAPYTVSSIAFVVSLGMRSPTSAAFICLYVMTMCITPQMLILGVLTGGSWDEDTRKYSTLKFSPWRTSGSQSFDSSESVARVQLVRTLSRVYSPDERDRDASILQV